VNWSGILVYSEDEGLRLELLGKGRELADRRGSKLYVVLIGRGEPKELIKYGADMVYVAQHPLLGEFSPEPYKSVLLKAMEKSSAEVILLGATKRGKELAARLAAALETGCLTDCLSLEMDEKGRLIAERLTYGGSAIAKVASLSPPHIATVPPRVFKKPESEEREGEVVELEVEPEKPKAKIVERREKVREEVDLEEAEVIVAAGRGFKKSEDLKLLEELAEVLGARMGCTRPIAADYGWMKEWIGISGHKVRPRLYIAVGISGTVHHAAGIRDCSLIVAINRDENANIFNLADYGIVGDLYEVLPKLTESLKQRLKR
jgi:electron transfer flavoprotein alpha subunit